MHSEYFRDCLVSQLDYPGSFHSLNYRIFNDRFPDVTSLRLTFFDFEYYVISLRLTFSLWLPW